MLIIEGFNGHRLEIPEDRYFLPGPEIWIQPKNHGKILLHGLTQAGLILSGGVISLEYLVEEGQVVSSGETVAFAVTNKVKYIETPLPGNILNLNSPLIDNPHLFQKDPYGHAWVFSLQLPDSIDLSVHFLTPLSYRDRLLQSEACGNPKGLKGGTSPTCRTIYSAIRSQKEDGK
jgi:glycine cleavage system H lipoate-binding protein